MKIKIRTNLCSGIFCILLAGIGWLLIGTQIAAPSSKSITVNARLFPQIFSIGIGVFGLILMIQSLVFHKEKIKEIVLTDELRVLGYLAIVLLFCVLIPVIGFLGSALLFTVVSLLFVGSRNKWHYVSVLLAAVVVYLAFKYGLGVNF